MQHISQSPFEGRNLINLKVYSAPWLYITRGYKKKYAKTLNVILKGNSFLLFLPSNKNGSRSSVG